MKGKVVQTSKYHDEALLPWSAIKELFEDQWVEIVDFEWEPESLFPRTARVKNFSSDRATLVQRAGRSKSRQNSAILYMGTSLNTTELQTAV